MDNSQPGDGQKYETQICEWMRINCISVRQMRMQVLGDEKDSTESSKMRRMRWGAWMRKNGTTSRRMRVAKDKSESDLDELN